MYSIGLMSGTSMDGIDAALLSIHPARLQHEMLTPQDLVDVCHAKLTYPTQVKRLLKGAERAIQLAQGDLAQATADYPAALRAYLAQELHLPPATIEAEVSDLTLYLHTHAQHAPLDRAGSPGPGAGLHTSDALHLENVIRLSTLLHAQLVHTLLNQAKLSKDRIAVIGYHGQTMYHSPERKISLQIGDGALLANLTGITVVHDFRRQDVEMGGQGAPFAPLYHQALAIRDHKIPLAVVNCGGIANLSLITGPSVTDVIGFDTGPGNGLIDALIRARTKGRACMDTDGHYGRQGKVHIEVLQALYDTAIFKGGQNYLLQPPAKSLDIRDMVLIPALDALSLPDACATLEAFTAETIVRSLDLLHAPLSDLPRHWILVGGGWYNPVITEQLTQRLQQKFGDTLRIETAAAAGWNNDAIEAQVFAYLAVRHLHHLPLSMPGTTGVPQPLCGGTTIHPQLEIAHDSQWH